MEQPASATAPPTPFSQEVSALDVSIIIPTYREAENLVELVPQIAQALEGAELRGEIIVVDDNSPDATAQVCRELSERFPLRLLVRKQERGLSSAVIHGLRHAAGKTLLVMDADLSHPPAKIPELVEAAGTEGVDFVIGSRYVAGGMTDDDWGLFRWLNSKVATWLARPLTSASDPMAGFFALQRTTFAKAKNLDPIGYKIGLELIVKAGCRSIREIPIQFRDRLHGESKLTLREQINYLRHLRRLYTYKLGPVARLVQFCLVGTTGMFVDLLVYSILLTFLPLTAARALAIWTAMTWNFALNRTITFSHARGGPLTRQYILFCASCLLGGVVNWGVSVGLCWAWSFFDQRRLWAAVLGILAGTAFNYVLSERVVFAQDKQLGDLPD